MSARADRMAELGVTQCPDWCTRDEEEELAYETHVGGWEQALDNGGVDEDVTVEVRPERDWWTEGEEENCPAFVRVTISGDGAAPHMTGSTADLFLTPDDVEALTTALTAAQRQAASLATTWVWAYDGAEEATADA